jgi:hypothetical protein
MQCGVERIVESERFQPLLGYSHFHLLPSDPPRFADADCSREYTLADPSWPLPDVSLSDGWRWVPGSQWVLDDCMACSDRDREGWQHAVDFGESWSNGQPSSWRGVRRRSWKRACEFDVNVQAQLAEERRQRVRTERQTLQHAVLAGRRLGELEEERQLKLHVQTTPMLAEAHAALAQVEADARHTGELQAYLRAKGRLDVQV